MEQTTQQQYLSHITGRINGLTLNQDPAKKFPEEIADMQREIKRLEAAFEDVKKNMPKEDVKAWTKARKQVATKDLAALTKKLDENKDRASH